MARLTLIINSDLDEVSLIAVAVHGICLHLGLNELQASEVELCVVEAMTNVIRHAYHGEVGYSVVVVIATDIDSLYLEISDSGTPMQPEQIERLIHGSIPLDPGPIDRASLPEAGRGLQIIHELMDEVAYAQDGSHNHLSLIKRISEVGKSA